MNLHLKLLLSSVTLLSSTAGAADLLVPAQFGSIQGAVDFAQPGDRIVIDKGIYDENVAIADKVDLAIKGKKGAIVAPTTPGFGLRFTDSQQIELRGLTVRNSTDTAIRFDDCSDVLIRKCVVEGAGFDGILVLDSTRVTITQNDVRDLDASGIAMLGEDGDGDITNNRIARAGNHGIFVHGPNFTVTGNEIEETALPGLEAEAFSKTFENVLFADNVLDRTRGIRIRGYVGVSLLDNVVSRALLDGVFLQNDANVLLSGNAIKKPGGDGIDLSVASTLNGNKVKKAAANGLLLRAGSDGSIVLKNTIKNAAAVSYVLVSSANQLIENKAVKSGQFDLNDFGVDNFFASNSFAIVSP